jgi:hypothetical protein
MAAPHVIGLATLPVMRHVLCFTLLTGFAIGQAGAAGLAPPPAWKRPPVQASASYTYDNNVTRALFAADQLSDHVLAFDAGTSFLAAEFDQSRLMLRVGLDGQAHKNYSQLNQLRTSVEASYQYRGSPDFDATTYAVQARASHLAAKSALRTGHEAELEASVRRAFTDRVSLFGAVAWHQRSAGSAVFSGHDRSVRLNLDYRVGLASTVYLGTELRHGELASTGLPSLESLDISSVLVQDTAFPNTGFFGYRFKARSLLATTGINFSLGRAGAIDLSWRRVTSQAVEKPSFLDKASRYGVNTYSLAYLVQF